jgi:hypothetical protein
VGHLCVPANNPTGAGVVFGSKPPTAHSNIASNCSFSCSPSTLFVVPTSLAHPACLLAAQVAVRQLPAPASSLAWHPSANMLLCGTTAGSFGIWPSTVPTDT